MNRSHVCKASSALFRTSGSRFSPNLQPSHTVQACPFHDCSDSCSSCNMPADECMFHLSLQEPTRPQTETKAAACFVVSFDAALTAVADAVAVCASCTLHWYILHILRIPKCTYMHYFPDRHKWHITRSSACMSGQTPETAGSGRTIQPLAVTSDPENEATGQ